MSEQLAAAGDCFTCAQTARGTDAPQRERVATTGHWRVAHAFDTSLPGWLVIVPRQHVLAFDELSIQACVELGPLVHDLTSALRECLGCTKTYLMQFSEAQGYSHLHLHLVPRMPDMPEEAKGPRCFTYLEVEESLRVPVAQVDLLAAALIESLASG
jgi:diadenosine tetraphosphate (Ap4A) HIT family hydrolase